MPIDTASAPSSMRRRAPWIALGLVLMWCAWLASRDVNSTADIARPLTRATTGAASPARPAIESAETVRARQRAVSLRQALAASSARLEFPPLTAVGRAAWAGVAPPAAPASAGSTVAAAVAPPVFPYQWVGMWTQPGRLRDGADATSMAIIAGPHSTWMVKQGDVLDEDWKIASISADQIQVTHLPTSSRQTITMSKQ